MQYSPKLKKAMEEIKEVLNKHDIAGMVIIHTPGYAEFLNKLNPSYSLVTQEGDNIRFKSKLTDFNGDLELQKKVTTDSLNMLQSITETAAHIIMPLIDFTEQLEAHYNAQGGGGTFTSHTNQNN